MIRSCKKIYLCSPSLERIAVLNGIRTQTVECDRQIKDYSTLEFEVDEYIIVDGQKIKSNCYDDLDVHMYLYLEDVGYFVMQYPATQNDGNSEYKSVTAYSIEKEFEETDWVNFKCNTGEKDSLEQLATDNLNDLGYAKEFITFYNPDNEELSLLHLILEKMPGWTIRSDEIDDILWSTKLSISESSTNLYALLTSSIAPKADCIFIFDIMNRRIRALYKDNLDDFDTNIFIGYRNLAKEIDIEVDEDSVFTTFTCSGSDDLTINNCNYNSSVITNLDYFLREPYMTDELAQKIQKWSKWRDDNRETFTQLSKDRADKVEKINELNTRLPADATDWSQWDNMTEELLLQNQTYYNALLTSLQVSVDNNPQYTQDDEGNNQDYIPWKNDDGTVDHDKYLGKLYNLENGYGGYYTYYEIITYILPNIQIAIDNLRVVDDDKKEYVKSYETNWELYGISELTAQKKVYEEKLESLSNFKKAWNDMTAEEQSSFSGGETQYNTTGRDSYVLYESYIGSEDTPDTILYCLKQLNYEADELNAELDEIDQKRNDMVAQADISHSSYGLTEKELLVYNRLCIHTDYTNSNILSTSIDTTVTEIDKEMELYEDSVDKLSEVSQPQISFTTEMDNLLQMDEFQGWVDDFQLLNFIHLGTKDDYSVKLRLIGYTYNPCEITDDITVTFCNMITSRNGRSDLTNLLANENNRASKNSYSYGTGNSSSEKEYLTSLLELMTTNNLFKSSVNDLIENGSYKTLQTYHLTGDNVVFDDAVIKYLIAANIAVADLRTGDITISNGMRILSENGRLIADGSALQILGKNENGEDYVGIQLGYDTTDTPSLILRNSTGALLLTPEGVTENAIADELIKTNMLANQSVTNGKIAWSDISDGVVDGKPVWNLSRIYTDNNEKFGAQYETFTTQVSQNLKDLSETTSNLDEALTNLKNTTENVSSIVDNNSKTIIQLASSTDVNYKISSLNVGGIELFDYDNLKSYKDGSLNPPQNFTVSNTSAISVTGNPNDYIGAELKTSDVKYIASGKAELLIQGYFERSDSEDDTQKYDKIFIYYKCFDEDNAEITTTGYKKLAVDTSSNLFVEVISLPKNTDHIYFGIGQEYTRPYTLKGVSVKDAAVYDITREIRDRLGQLKIEKDEVSIIVSDIDSKIGDVGDDSSKDTLFGKYAEISTKTDAIALSVFRDGDITSLTLSDGLVQSITKQFVIKSPDGDSTIVEGGKITTNELIGTNGTINLGKGTFDYGNGKLSWDGTNMIVNGAITATSLTLGTNVSISASKISGLSAVATSGNYSDLSNKPAIPQSLSDLGLDTSNIIFKGDITQSTETDSNGNTYTVTTVPTNDGQTLSYVTYAKDDYVLFGRGKGTNKTGQNYICISSNGLLTARNALIYGTVYASEGEFTGTIHATDGDFTGTIESGKGHIGGHQLLSNRILSANEEDTKAFYIATYDYVYDSTTDVHTALAIQGRNSSSDTWINRFEIRYDGSVYSRSEDGNVDMVINSGSITKCNSITATGSITANGHKLSHRILIDNKDNYGVGMSDSSGIFFPMVEGKADETANNKIQIGSSTNRFSEIYSVKALNTTSDQNLKENVEYFDERYEKAYMEFKPCTFTYRNFTESDCHDRRHFGLLSQPTEAVLLSNGICLDEAGFICKDSLETPNEAGQMIQYSMRYGELTALNMHMIQKAYLEISKLQNTISELENQIAELKKAGA